MSGKWIALSVLTSCCLNAQIMTQQARVALQRPTKLDVVVPVQQKAQVGQVLPIQIQLTNGAGEPVQASSTITAVVETQPSTGAKSSTTVTLSPGESSKQVDILATGQGLTKLTVREAQGKLVGGTNYIFSAPVKKTQYVGGHEKAPKKAGTSKGKDTSWILPPRSKHPMSAALVLARFSSDAQSDESTVNVGPPAAPSAASQLVLAMAGEDDANTVRADGTAFARVKVFYTGPGMPRDIRVWLQWSNGALVPNPVVIHQGELAGEAHWTSQFPIPQATLGVAATDPPALPFMGDTHATIGFTEPILGIDFTNAPTRMSIVDVASLTATFFDKAGNPLKTLSDRSVRFVSNSPILRLQPTEAKGNFDFSTLITPTYVGTSTIEVLTPGFHSGPHPITVTFASVLLISVLGGALGGFIAYVNSAGRLWRRISIGVIVGLLATWAYVYLGLPSTTTPLLHNQTSVVFVSMLAALGGVKAIAGITKALHLGF